MPKMRANDEGQDTKDKGVPGPNEGSRVGRGVDEDAEGHRFKFKGAPDTDTPPTDDTEGQGWRIGKATEGADEPPSDETDE